MKIVINTCYGGFGLSDDALAYYRELAQHSAISDWEIDRSCPHLIEVVETLGVDAEDSYSDLKIVEVPDDVQWEITYYDGLETVREISRTWS